jgi:hypothetical protein
LYGNTVQEFPITHQAEAWPLPDQVSHDEYQAYLGHVPHDVGGFPAAPEPFDDKEEEKWELNTYLTCECLGWRGVWNSEERRRRADNDLGAALYYELPYYGRWIWAAARMLVDKNHISLIELTEKIADIKARGGHDGMEAKKGVRLEAASTQTAQPATRPTQPSTTPLRLQENPAPPFRFQNGDRVRVKDAPSIFYYRTLLYVRGVTGTIDKHIYTTPPPEDEAFNRDDAQPQWIYIVRFKQKDLWPEYPNDVDTLQTEIPEGWLEAAR